MTTSVNAEIRQSFKRNRSEELDSEVMEETKSTTINWTTSIVTIDLA